MALSIADHIPAGWSGYKFNLVSTVADFACNVNKPTDGIDVHAWSYNKSNDNQEWELNLVDPNANIWTVRSVASGRKCDFE